MGKGDNRRPENVAAFKAGFERTFGSPPSEKELSDYDLRRAAIKERTDKRAAAELAEIADDLKAAIGRRTISHTTPEIDDDAFDGPEPDATGYVELGDETGG